MLQFGFLAAVFWWALIAFNMSFEVRAILSSALLSILNNMNLTYIVVPWRALEFG